MANQQEAIFFKREGVMGSANSPLGSGWIKVMNYLLCCPSPLISGGDTHALVAQSLHLSSSWPRIPRESVQPWPRAPISVQRPSPCFAETGSSLRNRYFCDRRKVGAVLPRVYDASQPRPDDGISPTTAEAVC